MIFYVLIFINVVVFLFSSVFLRDFLFANFALYYKSEFYSFLTYAFLHGDFNHILMNMIMLFMMAQLLKYFNKTHLLCVYFLGAIFSSLGYYYLMINLGYYNFVLVGASGAISALMGFAGIMLKQNGFFIAIIITSLISAFIFNNIAWQAHLFGALFGLCYAIFLKRR